MFDLMHVEYSTPYIGQNCIAGHCIQSTQFLVYADIKVKGDFKDLLINKV